MTGIFVSCPQRSHILGLPLGEAMQTSKLSSQLYYEKSFSYFESGSLVCRSIPVSCHVMLLRIELK